MSDDEQELTREHHQLKSNAGRCDICGEPIDMSSGDTLTIEEFGVDDEVTEEHGITDEEARNAVADALEQIGEDGADYDLAKTIREEGIIRVHDSCLEETAHTELEAGTPEAGA